ncbi:MAG TPA: hypothetical protein VFS20_23025 [Longimicrobium sp.]|nr:hypothetical protein [Longimicrobium sp.]
MSYSQRQIMLSLAYAAYIDNTLLTGTPTLDAQIKTDLQNALSATASPLIPPVAGEWTVVWGPVTYTVPGALYQDGMMYVVQLDSADDGGTPQYAVAVRGTNGTVMLDWLMFDFDILQMMPWPVGATGSDVVGQISESTSIGLAMLLNMQDGDTGDSLLTFLTKVMSNATGTTSICFTGHSLGAALSSTLALYMRDNQSTWDPKSHAIVTTVNFAGPTAGDQDFATYFDNQFAYTGKPKLTFWQPADSGSPSYADCVRNNLDIVPMLWNQGTMDTLHKIYHGHLISNDLSLPFGSSGVVTAIASALAPNQFTQIQSAQEAIKGKYIYPDDLPQGLSDYGWLAEAQYQHHCSYPVLLDVPALTTLLPNTISCVTT